MFINVDSETEPLAKLAKKDSKSITWKIINSWTRPPQSLDVQDRKLEINRNENPNTRINHFSNAIDFFNGRLKSRYAL